MENQYSLFEEKSRVIVTKEGVERVVLLIYGLGTENFICTNGLVALHYVNSFSTLFTSAEVPLMLQGLLFNLRMFPHSGLLALDFSVFVLQIDW